ncbi:DUF481 domain-containing protein [candidate division KSB1 bacterium]
MRYLFRAVYISILLILPLSVSAQVNTERMRLERVENGFSGRISINFSLKSGNVEVFETGSGLRLQLDADKQRAFVVGNLNFAKNRSVKLINRGFAHLRYNYLFRKSTRLEYFAQLEFNEFTRLFNRKLMGAGIKFDLYSGNDKGIYYGSSVMYESEHIDILKDSQDVSRTNRFRWSNYLVIKWDSGNGSALVNSIYIQPVFDEFNDIRILDEFDLQAGITSSLALVLSLRFRYDNLPPSGVKKADLEFMNSISYTF